MGERRTGGTTWKLTPPRSYRWQSIGLGSELEVEDIPTDDFVDLLQRQPDWWHRCRTLRGEGAGTTHENRPSCLLMAAYRPDL